MSNYQKPQSNYQKPQSKEFLDIDNNFYSRNNLKSEYNLTNGHGVLSAISNIQKDLVDNGGIAREQSTNQNNQNFGYKYRGIEDIYNALSPLFVNHGLVVVPCTLSLNVLKYLNREHVLTFKAIISIEFTILCIQDGSSVTIISYGEANDTTDKAVTKAESIAQRNAYIKLFNIPTKDENSTSDFTSDDNYPIGKGSDYSNGSYRNYNRTSNNNNSKTSNNFPITEKPATLEFKNKVDEEMRPHKVRLIDYLNRKNLDFETITHKGLIQVRNDFRAEIKNRTA